MSRPTFVGIAVTFLVLCCCRVSADSWELVADPSQPFCPCNTGLNSQAVIAKCFDSYNHESSLCDPTTRPTTTSIPCQPCPSYAWITGPGGTVCKAKTPGSLIYTLDAVPSLCPPTHCSPFVNPRACRTQLGMPVTSPPSNPCYWSGSETAGQCLPCSQNDCAALGSETMKWETVCHDPATTGCSFTSYDYYCTDNTRGYQIVYANDQCAGQVLEEPACPPSIPTQTCEGNDQRCRYCSADIEGSMIFGDTFCDTIDTTDIGETIARTVCSTNYRWSSPPDAICSVANGGGYGTIESTCVNNHGEDVDISYCTGFTFSSSSSTFTIQRPCTDCRSFTGEAFGFNAPNTCNQMTGQWELTPLSFNSGFTVSLEIAFDKLDSPADYP